MAILPNKLAVSDLALNLSASSANAPKVESRADVDIGLGSTVARSGLTLRAIDRAIDDLRVAESPKLALPTLQEGAKGKEVGLLQQALNALGYGDAKIDQMFGPKTRETVKSFQTARGLDSDGVAGSRETWPTLNRALAERHDDLTSLATALAADRPAGDPMRSELRQLNTVLATFGEQVAMPETTIKQPLIAAMPAGIEHASLAQRSAGEAIHIVRTGETLADIARLHGLPLGAVLASNSELAEPYLILPGQQLIVPCRIRQQAFRKRPRKRYPADPGECLANPNMNPTFVARVNGMIEQLRSCDVDARVIAGFRTFSEQQARYEQGRTVSGDVRSAFEAGHSWHNYGLAVDIAGNDDDGDLCIPESSSLFWQRLGDAAMAQSLLWGGVVGNPGHVEYHPGYGRNEADMLIEDFESYGLERVWAKIDHGVQPGI
ncbi:MAG: peptidoglycan-binding protein [Geminicoccaceae bacterium]